LRQEFLFNGLLFIFPNLISIKIQYDSILSEQMSFELRSMNVSSTFSGDHWKKPLRMKYALDGKFETMHENCDTTMIEAQTAGLIILHKSDIETEEDELSADLDF